LSRKMIPTPCQARSPLLLSFLVPTPDSMDGKRRGEKCSIIEQIFGTRAEPQQIVATRLLYCLQYPVPYLSRLQRIYPLQYLKLWIEGEDRPHCDPEAQYAGVETFTALADGNHKMQ